MGAAGFWRLDAAAELSDWAHQHQYESRKWWAKSMIPGPGCPADGYKMVLCLCPAKATWQRCGSADQRAVTATIETMWRKGHIHNNLLTSINTNITRIEPVGEPYSEVCFNPELWFKMVSQPNSLSKRLGWWIEHVLAYCHNGKKYVGCIELLFKLYRATCRY